jgi:hypothetical protein
MTRVKAALIHLTISVTLASIVIGLLVFGWYRLPYFWAVGGPMLLALIVGVDVVLGPLMTLIIFSPGKSRRALTFDLSVIALAQATALTYGLYAGYTSRLAYGVFVENGFNLVKATDIEQPDLARAKRPEFRDIPLFGPKLVGVELPTDPKVRSEMVFASAFGMGYQDKPEYFVPLSRNRDQIAKAGIPRITLLQRNPRLVTQIDNQLKSKGLNWGEVAVVPFRVKARRYTAVVKLSSTTLIDVLTENPLDVQVAQSKGT